MADLLMPAQSRDGSLDFESIGPRRLRYLCGVGLVSGLVSVPLMLLRQPNVGGLREGTLRPAILLPIWLAATLGVYLYARRADASRGRVLDLGLVYLVLSALGLSVFRHWLPYEVSDVVRGASPVALVMLVFAVVVPVRPNRMTAAAVGCVLMDFGGLWLTLALTKNPTPPWNMWLWLMAPTVVSAPIAVVTSRLLYRVGEQVAAVRRMGSYQLLELLGSGGMGQVWRAEHQRLARPAAVKLMRPQGVTDAEAERRMLQRFEREAQATAGLRSQHTIEVFDFGTATDGGFYYVMELLEGMDLQQLMAQAGPLPPERVVYLMLQACHSLREAHEAGLIHRDIKPANLFLCHRALEWDFVKVLDFGLVKHEAGEAETQLTADDSMLGSPGTMAPEMITGGAVDARADIYALGCVMYQLLAGRQVFEAKGALPMLMAHLHQTAAPLEGPAALTELIMRCIEKDPEARPQSILEVADALEATGLAEGWSSAEAEAWWSLRQSVEMQVAMDETLAAEGPTLRS